MRGEFLVFERKLHLNSVSSISRWLHAQFKVMGEGETVKREEPSEGEGGGNAKRMRLDK
jgi:hypothetical protein